MPVFLSLSTLQNITFDTRIFRKNVGNLGTIFVHGKIKTLLTCRHLIFDSNVFFNKAFLGINLNLKDSMVRIIKVIQKCYGQRTVYPSLSTVTIIGFGFCS